MTPKQNVCYWAEWRACAEALAKLGKAHDDAARKAMQAEAIGGAVKSSKDLTNPEFTRVLARFRSYSKPGDFAAQMHAENDSEEQRAATLSAIERLGDAVGIKGGLGGVGGYYRKFLGGVPVHKLSADKLRKLRFVLEKRTKKMRGEAEPKPAAPRTDLPTAPAGMFAAIAKANATEWDVAEGYDF